VSTTKFEEVIDHGIDYITATTRNSSLRSSLRDFGMYLVNDEVARGAKRRSSRANGYATAVADSVQCGTRYDGTIVRASSLTAREHWNQIYSLAENVTRIDVQLTYRPREGVQQRLARGWRGADRTNVSRGKPGAMGGWLSRTGLETIYLGSFKSDRLGRAYDKGRESRQDHYAGTLRLETQLRRELAMRLATQLDQTPEPDSLMVAYIFDYFGTRARALIPAIDPCLFAGQPPNEVSEQRCLPAFAEVCPSPRARLPSINRSISYLQNCIRPLVQRLSGAGYEREVLEALGLDHLVHLDQEDAEHEN